MTFNQCREGSEIDFLELIGIGCTFYRAKYRDAVEDIPSRANQEFAETLKEIFQ